MIRSKSSEPKTLSAEQAHMYLSKLNKINHIKGAGGRFNNGSRRGVESSPYMVRKVLEELFPVTGLPEPEAFHVGVIIAHGRVAVWCAV